MDRCLDNDVFLYNGLRLLLESAEEADSAQTTRKGGSPQARTAAQFAAYPRMAGQPLTALLILCAGRIAIGKVFLSRPRRM